MLWRCVVAVRPERQRRRLVEILRSRSMLVEEADHAVQLWRTLRREPADFVFVSESILSRPVEPSLEGIRALPDAPSVVVLRDHDDVESRARLLGAGCVAVLYTGMSDAALREMIHSVTTRRDESADRVPKSTDPVESARLGSFQSRNPSMHRVLEVARRVIPVQSSVLILGETGVGKEHLARAIHEQGPRAEGPFVPVNCAAIPESLFESELFGHEHGAFTGATRSHRGHFEAAHGGTVFLDEIGETPLHAQVKLLRVLQDRVIQRVGSETSIGVDVRIIAATNRDLERAVRDGRLRADLFYRIGVVTLTIPPLRERREDIPDLVFSFLGHFRERIPTEVSGVEDACMRALIAYEWPGNVRELINVIERALLITDGRELRLEDLPDTVRGGFETVRLEAPAKNSATGELDRAWLELPLREARDRVVASFERSYLEAQLQRSEGRVGLTARRSGISPRALFDKMRRHGLRKEDYKP